MRNDKLNTEQFFTYHFYDFMFSTDLDNTFTRSRALGGYSIGLFNSSLFPQSGQIKKPNYPDFIYNYKRVFG